MKILHGWIFHVYASGPDTVVQMVGTDDRVHKLFDRFMPAFYVGGEPKECHAVARFILEQSWDVKLSRVEWPDPSLGHPVRVLCIEVETPHHFALIAERVRYFKPKLTYYHHDLSLPELYLMARQIRPRALCEFAVDDKNRILGIENARSLTLEARRKGNTRNQ